MCHIILLPFQLYWDFKYGIWKYRLEKSWKEILACHAHCILWWHNTWMHLDVLSICLKSWSFSIAAHHFPHFNMHFFLVFVFSVHRKNMLRTQNYDKTCPNLKATKKQCSVHNMENISWPWSRQNHDKYAIQYYCQPCLEFQTFSKIFYYM